MLETKDGGDFGMSRSRQAKIRRIVNLSIMSVGITLVLTPRAWAGNATLELGETLPYWSVDPFIGILLSIALIPLFRPHWWEKNMGKVSAFWIVAFLVPFTQEYGGWIAAYKAMHIIVLDYIPFIILVGTLFVISGGIVVRGTMRGTPLVNGGMLMTGTLLASCIGTTGASMLLIRPLIRAIKNRKWKVHTIVFFIFMVSNIGGALTPLGDPPLFLGFLHGVPFFWTMRLALPMGLSILILISLYLLIDWILYKREKEGSDVEEAAVEDKGDKQPISIVGTHNLIFLAGVVGAVILGGIFNKSPLFVDQVTGSARGILLLSQPDHQLVLPWANLIRDGIILLMAWLSLRSTSQKLREENFFTWGPITEVAVLFAGIFLTMIPALEILQARGGEFGVSTPAQFFWATGVLSSFLDNAPTYLTFLSLAGGLGMTEGVATDLGTVAPSILMAISCGAVFMGANSYIGNAPNFMVRSIAEENGIKMPSFFGYMGWSVAILIPIFLLNTIIFF